MEKPFSPACERNQEPILKKLKGILQNQSHNLIEIGSGTGQHAAFMAPQMPHVTWQTSDIRAHHQGIQAWLTEAQANNLLQPLEIEIGKNEIPKDQFDILYSANVLHIISWDQCLELFQMLDRSLRRPAHVIFYGPFKYNSQHTSPSNVEFDISLKQRSPLSGIRDFEAVAKNLNDLNFALKQDYEMPANNRLLHFESLA